MSERFFVRVWSDRSDLLSDYQTDDRGDAERRAEELIGGRSPDAPRPGAVVIEIERGDPEAGDEPETVARWVRGGSDDPWVPDLP